MPKSSTPMQITLYDPETNEAKATFTRLFVPWKLLKAAVKLAQTLNAENLSDEDVDALAGLVVEVFGNKFSIEELNECSDITEMTAVLNMIIAKASGGLANPTLPGK